MSLSSKPIDQNQEELTIIDALIRDLADDDGREREKARNALARIGKPAVEPLVQSLSQPDEQVRWEAAKALSQIGDPSAAPALVRILEDPSFGVRWLAAEGLIVAGSEGLEPLLEALIHRSDSVWLREGAHHVLRSLATEEGLHDVVAPVLKALKGIAPVIGTPLAAQRALRLLRQTYI